MQYHPTPQDIISWDTEPLRQKVIRNDSLIKTQDVIDQFNVSKAHVWKSKKTAEAYRTILVQVARSYTYLPTKPEEIESFLASRNVAPYTLFTYHHLLKTFYLWVERRLGIGNPMPLVARPPSRRPRPRIFSLDELATLLNHPSHPGKVRVLLNLLTDTGIRIGEAACLKAEDVRGDSVIVRGKGGVEREVPCTPDICEALLKMEKFLWERHHPQHREFLFEHGSDSLAGWVEKAFKRAGFTGKKLGPHALRHTFATLWEGSEVDLQTILGHSSPQMTFWYRQFRIGRAKEAHQRYSPRNQALRRRMWED